MTGIPSVLVLIKLIFLDDLLIDDYNQKWGVLARGNGLFVYNDNNTISDLSDDEYKKINTSVGSNLPSMQTYCVEKDFNGEVWVGTDKGVAVFYNPEAVFTGFNFDSEQILITEGDYGQYLLSEGRVKCIYIDGANRKWIGTEKSGVFFCLKMVKKKSYILQKKTVLYCLIILLI